MQSAHNHSGILPDASSCLSQPGLLSSHALPLQEGAQNAVAAAASLGGGRSPGSNYSSNSSRYRSRELLAEEDVEYVHAMVLQDKNAYDLQNGEPAPNHPYMAVRCGPPTLSSGSHPSSQGYIMLFLPLCRH